ncbi:MAG TPA: helix-turn-helix transcriptional regulator [Oscillospiraceae bacterium]|nr:helix-turn-helix transcriptional regulator [Oscillospiraceae bacterium]
MLSRNCSRYKRAAFTIQLLAERINVSQGHFCRLFKQYTMKTPIQYMNHYRLSKAMEFLQTTNRKILDIALDTGFSSLSYFINVFQKNIGCTPSAYRKRMKAKD